MNFAIINTTMSLYSIIACLHVIQSLTDLSINVSKCFTVISLIKSTSAMTYIGFIPRKKLRQEGNQQYKKFVDTKRKEQIYAELQNKHKKDYNNWYTYHEVRARLCRSSNEVAPKFEWSCPEVRAKFFFLRSSLRSRNMFSVPTVIYSVHTHDVQCSIKLYSLQSQKQVYIIHCTGIK